MTIHRKRKQNKWEWGREQERITWTAVHRNGSLKDYTRFASLVFEWFASRVCFVMSKYNCPMSSHGRFESVPFLVCSLKLEPLPIVTEWIECHDCSASHDGRWRVSATEVFFNRPAFLRNSSGLRNFQSGLWQWTWWSWWMTHHFRWYNDYIHELGKKYINRGVGFEN